MNKITLHLGDCLEYMATMPSKSVGAIVTDPPYGVNGNYNSYNDTVDNLAKLVPLFLKKARRIAKDIVVVFTGVKNIDLYPGADWTLAWVVPAGTGVSSWGFTCWTPIKVYGKDPFSGLGSRPDVFVDYKPHREGWNHPYEKPLSVMRWCIERCVKRQAIVFDPFMGTATTLIPCIETGRFGIGCEIDPTYFAIAERRIKQAQMQLNLFEDMHE